jgi:oxygen-independent coproporphyrinogen-3 oxidase
VKELGVRVADQLGVYVSVPFCRAKCSFCNFASGVGTASAIESYVVDLCAEIDAAAMRAERLGAELPRSVDTVYFGGGTPSLLTTGQLGRVFGALRRNFEVSADAEITLEAAPGQIADDVLDEAMRLGVSRVSLGVQSFVDRESASVGRLHTEQECVSEIRRLQSAGILDVGADLIAGLPYQTAESWEHSLGIATSLGLAHLSVYMLEVDEDSRLGREVMAGGQRFHAHGVPADEIAADLYEAACERLPGAGFAQYEISNFAAVEKQIPCGNDKKGSGNDKKSRHNVKYWKRAPYMGFGLDAHSMLKTAKGAVRFANAGELSGYGNVGQGGDFVMLDQNDEVTVVGEREAFEETVFLGLRMCEGIDLAGLRRDWVAEFETAARELVREGLMSQDDGRWKLTLRGRLVSNDVFGRLLETVAC